jgi:choline dehydrogenase-like flavoprotein
VVQRKMRGSVMVVGAGVGGMRAAVDLADSGYKVYLLDSAPSIGGIVSQLGFMFPTHDCVLCRGTSDHGYGCFALPSPPSCSITASTEHRNHDQQHRRRRQGFARRFHRQGAPPAALRRHQPMHQL